MMARRGLHSASTDVTLFASDGIANLQLACAWEGDGGCDSDRRSAAFVAQISHPLFRSASSLRRVEYCGSRSGDVLPIGNRRPQVGNLRYVLSATWNHTSRDTQTLTLFDQQV